MNRRSYWEPAIVVVAGASGLLWALRPARPTGALAVLIDIVGVLLGLVTIGIVIASIRSAIRSARHWARVLHRDGVRTTTGWTLQSAAPLLVCLAGLVIIGVLVTQLN